VVIIDDASPDQTGLYIQRYLDKHNISSSKVTLIRNKQQRTAVPNLHLAATKYCREDEIGFFVDGDDELVGVKAFKIFNAVYQKKKPAIAYSIAFEWWVLDGFVKDNWSQ
jgi:glycosyltransferase involved in cell wall biosynthesis